MTARTLIDTVVRAGGVLSLSGDKVTCRLPNDALHLADDLRTCKPEIMELLRKAGGRLATFPHCPRCASYALYREDNIGVYECMTCGLQNIEEATARRLQ